MKANFLTKCSASVALGAAMMLSSPVSHAALVTSSFSGTVVDFSQFTSTISGAGPTEVGGLVGESISFSSSVSSALLFNGGYGLVDNGNWTSARAGYAALDNTFTPGEYIQFTFNDGAVHSVGGFMNYCVAAGLSQCSPDQHFIIEALGAGDVSLEVYDITAFAPISTPGGTDAGEFRGIVRASNDIVALRLYNAVNVIDDLTFARDASVVPEPGSITLVGLALAGLAGIRRRKSH